MRVLLSNKLIKMVSFFCQCSFIFTEWQKKKKKSPPQTNRNTHSFTHYWINILKYFSRMLQVQINHLTGYFALQLEIFFVYVTYITLYVNEPHQSDVGYWHSWHNPVLCSTTEPNFQTQSMVIVVGCTEKCLD